MPDVRQGGCLCGAARYEINVEGHKTGNCHCVDCQKNSGAAFMPFMTVDAGQFRWLAMPSGAYVSSDKVIRRFCTVCGSPITWESKEKPDNQSVSLGSLDRVEGIEITYEIYTRSRLKNILPVAEARQYEGDNG